MIIEKFIEDENDIESFDMLTDVIDVIQDDIMCAIDCENFPNTSAIAMMELARILIDDEEEFIETAFSVAEKFDCYFDRDCDCDYADSIVALCLSGK
jgi:hypothetical protein